MSETKSGYTQVDNGLLEKLAIANLNRTEHEVMLVVIRQTIGWENKDPGRRHGAAISISYFAEKTGRDRSGVRQALKKLPEKNILIQVSAPSFSRAGVWKINEELDEWEDSSRGEKSSTVLEGSISQGEKSSTQGGEQSSTLKIKEKKIRKKGRSADADARFQPFVKFATEEFYRQTGLTMPFNGSDGKVLSDGLRQSRGEQYNLENIKRAWTIFLTSDDPFEQKHIGAHPIRFFVQHLNSFLMGDSRLGLHHKSNAAHWDLGRSDWKPDPSYEPPSKEERRRKLDRLDRGKAT